MRDYIIRRAFHKTVLKAAHADMHTIVVDELGLKNGGVRADIAVLNGKLVGYEIKTENDTLSRLPYQMEVYSEVFDKAFIIVSDNHFENALQLIPNWWGVYKIVAKANGNFTFSCYRQALVNKSQNTFTLARLLWKSEAKEVATKCIETRLKSHISKNEIYELISQNYSKKKMSKIVIQYLKQRNNWRQGHQAL